VTERPAVAASRARDRGTVVQRLRAGALAAVSWLACHLPERPQIALANLVGHAWYRLAPERAAQARRNLGRVVSWLAAEGKADARIRAAAGDPRALERLVRAAFVNHARYYLEILRIPALRPAIFDSGRIVVENPEAIDEVFAGGPVIFISGHIGPIELPGLYLAHRSGRTFVGPMETVGDPALQDWFVRTRGALGVRIVGLREARRELLAALEKGESVGLVADRDIFGGGIPTSLFGAPAPLPIGPALLAIESGRPIHAAGVRRLRDGRIAGRLLPVPVATDGTRRQRIEATLAAEARAFEELIALAPEQWGAVFFPIWPDLAAAPPTPAPVADRGAAA
jgi:KDO2-lipid IV(A) lauroyltransferase